MVKKAWSFICSIFFVFIMVNPGFSLEKRPITVDDVLNIVDVDDVVLSPDGRHVFYSLRKLNWEKNNYTFSYYLSDADGRSSRLFLREGLEGSNFKFSPDGRFLSFLSKVGKRDQLFLIPVDGGEAQAITNHPVSIKDYQWLKDCSGIVFLADEARSEEEQKEYELGADAVFVDEQPNGKENARFSRLWFFDFASKTATNIFKGKLVIEEFEVSPKGDQVVFVGLPDTRTNYPFLAEIYLVNRDGSGFQRVTYNQGPESDLKWSPDGGKIMFHAPYYQVKGGKYELSNGSFWLYFVSNGKFRRLTSQNQGEMYGGIKAWSADSRYFYFNELHGTKTNLYRIDVEKDQLEALTDTPGTLWVRSFSQDLRKMAYIYQDYQIPPDVYVSDLRLKNPVKITDSNPWIRKEILLSSAQVIRWRSEKGGLEVEGMFYLPPQRQEKSKLPLIVHIHGGPAGVVDNSFRPEFHLFGGLGYALLAPNYRGSTGYGDEFLQALKGEVGDGEHADIMSGVDYVLKHYPLNPEQLAVRGWSWGGVSTGYLITHVHRFKAASAGAGVYNWAAETGPGFNFDVSLWYIGGTPWDNPEEWAKRSAITYVKDVRTPVILFHGGRDTTSSVNQSLMFFTALRDIGQVPVRYVKFPREGHGIREPRHRRILMIEEIRWFEKYVRGKDWSCKKRKIS